MFRDDHAGSISIMVFGNVEFEAAVLGKQVSYYMTQRISVAGVFSSFGDSVTKDLSNGFGNVVTVC